MEILDLPDDVMLAVFSFVTVEDLLRVHKVCRQWKNLAESKSLWWKINLTWRGSVKNNNGLFRRCLNVTSVLRTLTIQDFDTEQGHDVVRDILSSRISRVKKLDINLGMIKHEDLATIVSWFSDHLIELRLVTTLIIWDNHTADFSGEDSPDDWEENLKPIIANLPKLKTFITDLPSVPNGPFRVFDHDWPSLQQLDLRIINPKKDLLDLVQNHHLLFKTKDQLKILRLPIVNIRNLEKIPELLKYCSKMDAVTVGFSCGIFIWSAELPEKFTSLEFESYMNCHWDCFSSETSVFHSITKLRVVVRYSSLNCCVCNVIKSCTNLKELVVVEPKGCCSKNLGVHTSRQNSGEAIASMCLNAANNLNSLTMIGCCMFAKFDTKSLTGRFPGVQIQLNHQC